MLKKCVKHYYYGFVGVLGKPSASRKGMIGMSWLVASRKK
jgi:hypothetical protein